jgi:predicted dehydrogenase
MLLANIVNRVEARILKSLSLPLSGKKETRKNIQHRETAMIKLGIIGLDTSHSVEFPKRMQAPDCPEADRVAGLRAVTCLRFETPFQNKAGLDQRQKQLEAWGVKVTESFDEAAAGCDAYLMEINDPAFHLDYFRKLAGLGKPIFLDKPLAGTLEDGREILRLARQHNTRVWSGSSLPFSPPLSEALAPFSKIHLAHVYGALGKAPAGDSLIWYGVHVFETLQRIMGPGATSVTAREGGAETVAMVDYGGGRQGLVECIPGCWNYGGRAHGTDKEGQPHMKTFVLPASYPALLKAIQSFLEGGPAPVSLADSFEGLAIMVAARQSIETGKPAPVATPSLP